MRKREIEAFLKQFGWCQDERHDHREWWNPSMPWVTIWTDRVPREGRIYVKLEPPIQALNPENLKPLLNALLLGRKTPSSCEAILLDLYAAEDAKFLAELDKEIAKHDQSAE